MFLRIHSKNAWTRNVVGEKEKIGKKSKQDILSFDWRKGIAFGNTTLDIKMLPKEYKKVHQDRETYMIIDETGNSIAVETIGDRELQFLQISGDGIISPKNVSELGEEDSLITFLTNENGEYTISDINEIALFENDGEDESDISNYIIKLPKEGLIINDFFLC
jgi:hypothetical protein